MLSSLTLVWLLVHLWDAMSRDLEVSFWECLKNILIILVDQGIRTRTHKARTIRIHRQQNFTKYLTRIPKNPLPGLGIKHPTGVPRFRPR